MQCILYNKKSKTKTIYTIFKISWHVTDIQYCTNMFLIIFWIVTTYPLCYYHLIMHSSVAQPYNEILYLQWCCSCWMKVQDIMWCIMLIMCYWCCFPCWAWHWHMLIPLHVEFETQLWELSSDADIWVSPNKTVSWKIATLVPLHLFLDNPCSRLLDFVIMFVDSERCV